jgi:ABC-type spermidine/putrescine transport system permease subunit II
MIVQLIMFQIDSMLNWGFAGAISMLLLGTVLLIFFFYDRWLGLSTLSGGTQGKATSSDTKRRVGLGARFGNGILNGLGEICAGLGAFYDKLVKRDPARSRADYSRRSLWVVAGIVIFFLAAPTFFIIPVSFTEEGFLTWPPKGFSLQWYETVFADSSPYPAAFLRSVLVALFAGFFAMLIGVPAAFMLVRKQFFGKSVIFAFLVSPIITPHIILAVSLFYLFARLHLIGTYLGLILGHTVITMPYVIVTVMAVIKNYDLRLDQAAWTLGAGKLKTLWFITFPIIKGGLIAAFMFAFIISFDELTMAIYLTGGEFATLPKHMWVDAIMRVNPTLAAVATLMLLFMTAIILVSEFLRRRSVRKIS